MTRSDLDQMPTSEILALFNQLTGRETKKFSSREAGIKQTLKALGTSPQSTPTTPPAARRARKSSGLSFRLAPHAETKAPREGTKRAKVLELVSKPEGALFSEIQTGCGWGLKDAYEGVRLLNRFCGYGLWHEKEGEDYRIFQVDAETFSCNVREANGRA